MAAMTTAKEIQWAANDMCKANETCPELFDPDSEGHQTCVDGEAYFLFSNFIQQRPLKYTGSSSSVVIWLLAGPVSIWFCHVPDA